MAVYIPNIGEKEVLMDILTASQLRLGLYKNQVTPDGNTVFETLTEVDEESGGYATKDLVNVVVTDALTAAKWYVSTNASGKGEAKYGAVDTYEEWVFNAADVANAATAYGVMMWTLVLPFTSGGTEEPVAGDTLIGVSSSATALITHIRLHSGTWAGGDAAGEFCIKTQTGTYQSEGVKIVASDVGTITADSVKRLIAVEAFTTGKLIETVGQKIQYTPVITAATA